MDEPPLYGYETEVTGIRFYPLGNKEILENSVVEIAADELSHDSESATGLNDARLGVSDSKTYCLTCRNNKENCVGHFGHINLKYPVISPVFMEDVFKWLKVVCFNCGALIVNKIPKVKPIKILDEIAKAAQSPNNKFTTCSECSTIHPYVIINKLDRTVHIEFPNDKTGQRNYRLYIHEIQQILNKISDATVVKLGKSADCHPRKFVLNTISVPPQNIRPNFKKIGGNRNQTNEITGLYKKILAINRELTDGVISNVKQEIQNCDTLNFLYYEMLWGTGTSSTKMRLLKVGSGKPVNSIASRIPKKKGRIRGNLLGKRTYAMARSVITGDSMIPPDSLGVPQSMAIELTIPETVRFYNKDRLMIYLRNGPDNYPGCTRIWKAKSRTFYWAKLVAKKNDFILEDGDIVHRHIINGDIVGFNRQPSLLPSSIRSFKAIVMNGEHFRMNPTICVLFNADFDGDAMHMIVFQNIVSLVEMGTLATIPQGMISFQYGTPLMGSFQDGLVSLAMLSKGTQTFSKFDAMSLMGNVPKFLEFSEKTYTNRNLISMLLPEEFVYRGKPEYFNLQYAPYVDYDEQDITVKITNGVLESGILDKKTVGQKRRGTIYHNICNESAPTDAIDLIFELQQFSTSYIRKVGYTISPRDIMVEKSTTTRINEIVAETLKKSQEITQQLDRGELIPPIGFTTEEYYETMQIQVLSGFDQYIDPVMRDIGKKDNNFLKLSMFGSKGDINNILQCVAVVGQILTDGSRMPLLFGDRTLPYFTKYDTDPIARGFVTTGYTNGLGFLDYFFAAYNGRRSLIDKALTTSVTGDQNRISIKHLESMVVTNLRTTAKAEKIVQYLFSSCGIDPRKRRKVKFNLVMLSDAELEKYHSKVSDFDWIKNVNTRELQKELDDEFQQLKKDRDEFRRLFLEIENRNGAGTLLSIERDMPVDVFKHIEDQVQRYGTEEHAIDPSRVISKVKELCETLHYAFTNSTQLKRRSKLPEYLKVSTELMEILIRTYLNTAYLREKKISTKMFENVISGIWNEFKDSLIEYGLPIGVISAQCMSEPPTQFVLNSHHRSGKAGGSATNALDRSKEIFGLKPADKMKNPTMFIPIKEEFRYNKQKVQEIANHIEVFKLKKFLNAEGWQILYENMNNLVYPKYKKHDTKMIEEYVSIMRAHPPPNDLLNWCIRYELDIHSLILKNMRLETVLMKLRESFPHLYFIHTTENSPQLIIRIYPRNVHFSKGADLHKIQTLNQQILDTVLRGISGILNTHVIDQKRNVIQENGEIVEKTVYAITTDGVNLDEIILNPFVDAPRVTTDSLPDMFRVFGIEALRERIIVDLKDTIPGVALEHYEVYADEMTRLGRPIGIQRPSMSKRENDNPLLRMAMSGPKQVIADVARNGVYGQCYGLSAPIILGTTPHIGSTYNTCILNEEFIQKNMPKELNVEEIEI